MAFVINNVSKEKKTWNIKTKKKRNKKKSKTKEITDENNNHKTSASILYELLAKEGKWPVYEILLEKPATPWFIYRVSCVNILLFADGEGSSKKKAKQAAAEAFIYLLIYKVIKSPPESPQNDHDFTSKLEVFENLDKTIEQGNFIGALQEFCFRWGLSKPSYRFEMEIGESKTKLFFVSCELPKLGEAIRTFGSSGKKKAAKQIAAEEMWHKVHNEMDETSRA